MADAGVLALGNDKLRFLDPLPYMQFLRLQSHAMVVITDSGGIQEETTFLGVPCLTVRENTERPVTLTCGTNVLVGRDVRRLQAEVEGILDGRSRTSTVPPLWDGKAAERIADIVTGVTEPLAAARVAGGDELRSAFKSGWESGEPRCESLLQK